jgi:hypothetical protein
MKGENPDPFRCNLRDHYPKIMTTEVWIKKILTGHPGKSTRSRILIEKQNP